MHFHELYFGTYVLPIWLVVSRLFHSHNFFLLLDLFDLQFEEISKGC